MSGHFDSQSRASLVSWILNLQLLKAAKAQWPPVSVSIFTCANVHHTYIHRHILIHVYFRIVRGTAFTGTRLTLASGSPRRLAPRCLNNFVGMVHAEWRRKSWSLQVIPTSWWPVLCLLHSREFWPNSNCYPFWWYLAMLSLCSLNHSTFKDVSILSCPVKLL